MPFRRRREHDLDRELQAHLDLETEEHRQSGLPLAAARYAARRALGNTTYIREETRNMWGWTWLERLAQDVRYAARVFARNPGFASMAVLSLALGVGGSAAMFSLVNALLLRPLPYTGAERLVRVTGVYPKAGLAQFQEQSRTMEIAAAGTPTEWNVVRGGEAVRAVGAAVSANLFSVLQAPAALGRVFRDGEQRPDADRSVILSYPFWRRAWHGSPGAVGSLVTIDGVPREVVGVMPEGFAYPSARVQYWIPARIDSSNFDDYWGRDYMPLVARLRPGANMAQAASEAAAMMAALRARFPFPMSRNYNSDVTVLPLQADLVGDIRSKLLVLFAAVGIVLLIACANVSGLLLSRAAVRRKEMALRAALGAGRSRIVRQLLTESVLLAALGAGCGLALAQAALSVFKPVLPPDTAGLGAAGIDWQVAGFVSALAALTGIAFGIVPSLSAARIDLAGVIKTGTARARTPAAARLRGWLIAGEVALTVVLLVSAGLLLKSLHAMSTVDPGFRSTRILAMRVSPEPALCARRDACVALYGRLLEQVRGIPGTASVAAASSVPMDGTMTNLAYDVEGHPRSADFPSPMIWTGAVTPDYFSMLRIPLLGGRNFSSADGARSAAVAILSAAAARRFWPGESAIGKHVRVVWEDRWRTVVGVVADVRQFSLAQPNPDWIAGAAYLPYPQAVQEDRQIPAAMTLLVKTSGPTARVAAEIREAARQLNPTMPVEEARSLDDVVAGSNADFRATIWVFLSFALAAVVLAAVGIYGLVSHTVAQRTYEIGLRVAVGATRGEILRLMLGRSVRLAAMGIGAGVVASLALTRFLAGFLFGVGAADPETFTLAGGLVLAVAVLASYLPALRASRLDPVSSLRAE